MPRESTSSTRWTRNCGTTRQVPVGSRSGHAVRSAAVAPDLTPAASCTHPQAREVLVCYWVMLLRFSVSNHLSIRDRQELLFSVSGLENGNDGLIRCSAAPGGTVLPVAVIYGANASGKSNLIEAIHFVRSMVLSSHSKGEPGRGVPVRPFRLGTASGSASSRFEVDFVIETVRYHYGFEASGKAFEEEWLYAFPGGRRQMWFDRVRGKFRFGRELKGKNRVIADLTRPNSLFISAAAQNDHMQLSRVFSFFQSIGGVQGLGVPGQAVSSLLTGRNGLDKRVIDFLGKIRTGVVDYRQTKTELPPAIREFQGKLVAVIKDAFGSEKVLSGLEDEQHATVELGHNTDAGEVVYFDLEAESDGTRRLLVVLSAAFEALDAGTILCVDELNASLHTQASEAVLRLFCSRKFNPNGAQLLTTTHDTNLLASASLRRDEVWLTEKDEGGATHLYPLTDIETQDGDNLEKGYLQGRYGAVPFANPESAIGKD